MFPIALTSTEGASLAHSARRVGPLSAALEDLPW
jgi:hypothetical protein